VQIDISSCLQKLTVREDITITPPCKRYFPVDWLQEIFPFDLKLLVTDITKSIGENVYAVLFSDWNLHLLLLSVGKKLFFNGISDHQQSRSYEDCLCKGPGPPLLVAADLSQFISRRHRSGYHHEACPRGNGRTF
jgi:hypothetical protein